MLTVIIPSLNCKYAARTVDDLFEKATGEIEVIILLDDYWPDPPLKKYKTLITVHKGSRTGMRTSITMGVKIASGKYIMKCDDHCMFGKGFDELLQKDMQPDWLVIPSRYSLDPEKWERRREAEEYEYMAYPYANKTGIGLYSKKWIGDDGIGKNMGMTEFYKRENERKHILIDDIMIFKGSCWFMEKDHFFKIGGLFDYETMYQEPAELTFKTWLSGGRCVVNKNTWYAHWFKSKEDNRGYYLDLHAMRKTEKFGNWYWMNNQWEGQIRPMKWLVDKFWPIPGWPEDWEEDKIRFETQYPNYWKES